VKLITNEIAAEARKADDGWLDAHRSAPGRIPDGASQQSFRTDRQAGNRNTTQVIWAVKMPHGFLRRNNAPGNSHFEAADETVKGNKPSLMERCQPN
jgi:hypothetical protein